MNATLIKAVVLMVPVAWLFAYSILLLNRKAPWSVLQVIGASCLLIVVLTHVCEALRIFSSMAWGAAHSAGHYLDLSSAVLGLTLFPAGFILRRRAGTH